MTTYRVIGIGMLLVLFAAWHVTAAAAAGEDVGPMTATVFRTDDPRGLTVRSDPSAGAPPVGYLPSGTRVRTYREFSGGWVRIHSPIQGGWVDMANLNPVRGVATVVSVDSPENCLRVRSGPGSSYEVVGCLGRGERLRLTGIWSSNNWLEIDGPVAGWVFGGQIQTTLVAGLPPAVIPVPGPSYVIEAIPPLVPSPAGRYYSYRYPYWHWRYRYHHRYPYRYDRRYEYYPYRYGRTYRAPGVGVRVSPYSGVAVRAGGVGVSVSPRHGVGVNAGGVRVGVSPYGGVRVGVGRGRPRR